MKITAFNPLILTSKSADTVALLEELDFARAHTKTGIEENVTSIDLKYGEDFRVDVAGITKFDRDMTVIRMNVRDFDEAYDFLISKGFKNVQGDKITETGSSKDTLMISPTGFAISLSEHIRK
jgi:hypothetical protein